MNDLYDVTLGSPAVFRLIQIQIIQQEHKIIRPVVFRPPLAGGLALYGLQVVRPE